MCKFKLSEIKRLDAEIIDADILTCFLFSPYVYSVEVNDCENGFISFIVNLVDDNSVEVFVKEEF